MSTSNPPKRGPGAPTGNANAYKNGMYTRRFKKQKSEALTKLSNTFLLDAIDGLRVFEDRFVKSCQENPNPSRDQANADLRTFAASTLQITRLVRLAFAMQADSLPVEDKDDWLDELLTAPQPAGK